MIELVLAQIQTPIAEIRYAQEMGRTQGDFYCQAFRMGAYTPSEMAIVAIKYGGDHVREAFAAHQYYVKLGDITLMSAFLTALQNQAIAKCPQEFNYYLKK